MKLEEVLAKLSAGEYTNAKELESLLRLKIELEKKPISRKKEPVVSKKKKPPKKKIEEVEIKPEEDLDN